MAVTIPRPMTDPAEYDEFSCDPNSDVIETPDKLPPTVRVFRKVHGSFDVTMPDGRDVRFWGFVDPNTSGGDRTWPSPLIRVRQGQIIHATLDAAKNTHTIHWHGIEPSTMNDGVGHTSFEVSNQYTYQWQAKSPGTYFYHCHKNTVLHFEMGMYGPLVIDPPSGPGLLFERHPADEDQTTDLRYQAEAIWSFDDVDPRWHELNHAAGLCGEDAGLNRFQPKYFLISGVPHPRTERDTRVVVRAKKGQNILLRAINATYSNLDISIGVSSTIVEMDGRPLRTNPQLGTFSKPIPVAAKAPTNLTPAQRTTFMIHNAQPGRYEVTATYRDWITNRPHAAGGIARTWIEVT
ncbi:FtsP/CotA-like multicopper oxidase with cupredoxin domain [Skermanella aerolata]|uniref:multicopper oxidase domain-containing protein n=1 Tax=Skermanella aerolata TaxID=393310 RepID=UPI003D1FE924